MDSFYLKRSFSDLSMKGDFNKRETVEMYLDKFKKYILSKFDEGEIDFKYYEPIESGIGWESLINMEFNFKK